MMMTVLIKTFPIIPLFLRRAEERAVQHNSEQNPKGDDFESLAKAAKEILLRRHIPIAALLDRALPLSEQTPALIGLHVRGEGTGQ